MMTSVQELFNYDEALGAAQEVVSTIEQFCQLVEICGGIRRKKDQCHDLDIVCQSTDRFSLNIALGQICTYTKPTTEKTIFKIKGIPGEIYFVQNEQEFEVMKLERTGDSIFTKTLAQNAITKGMVFRFSRDKGYYKIPMYGLYKITGTWWDEEADRANRKHYLIGDMVNAVAWRETDIIKKVFDRMYEPQERNFWDGGSQQSESGLERRGPEDPECQDQDTV